MIDFHNHVLPAVDDGSPSLEVSLRMLRTAAEQGVTDVVNTVHFQHPKFSGQELTGARLDRELALLQQQADAAGIPVQLHRGAEVFYLPNLLELKDNPLATLGHGRYMLVEFPLHTLPPNCETVLFKLVLAGVTPVLAHPERTRNIQEDPGILRRLVRSGCLVQVDGGSLTGSLGNSAHKAAVTILRQGLCHLLGSDAHDDGRRNFLLPAALPVAEKLLGARAARELVTANPRRILDGEPFEADTPVADLVFEAPSLMDRIRQRWQRRS